MTEATRRARAELAGAVVADRVGADDLAVPDAVARGTVIPLSGTSGALIVVDGLRTGS